MSVKFLVLAAFIFGGSVSTALADPSSMPISSFGTARKIARDEIYKGHQTSLYCGCAFVHSGTSGGEIDNIACGYEPRKNEARGKQMEWEHIVPAWFFGHNRSCWEHAHSRCETSTGRKYAGRRCCAEVDKEIKRIEADLHNLAPSEGEMNGDRYNLPYGEVSGEPREYGACDFEIDRAARVAEPADAVRGTSPEFGCT